MTADELKKQAHNSFVPQDIFFFVLKRGVDRSTSSDYPDYIAIKKGRPHRREGGLKLTRGLDK